MLKLGFTHASISIFKQPISFRVRPIYCSTISCLPTSPKPQTPLFLRPPTYKATIQDLQKWHLWAKNLAASAGSTFLDLDNGPDSTLLLRELNWLIEDALEHPKTLVEHNYNNATEVGNKYDSATEFYLRACVDDLYMLWKQRVEERRPFQYVVGCEHWRDLVLSVEEGVLIPRPETELIVDLVENAVKGNEELKEGLWADLGTGSGALAIGIGRILGASGRVTAVDLSPVAVAVASYNVQRTKLQLNKDLGLNPSRTVNLQDLLAIHLIYQVKISVGYKPKLLNMNQGLHWMVVPMARTTFSIYAMEPLQC